MQYHVNAVDEVLLNPSMFGGYIDRNSAFGQDVHLLDWHLLPMFLEMDDLFGRLATLFEYRFESSHTIFFGIELGLMGVAAIAVIAYCWTINSCYDILLVLIRRISPAHVLSCEALENYLLNKSTGRRREGLTPDERMIDSSVDCIICMGPTGVIDLINPAVIGALGYTPEHLLGQLLLQLLAPDQAERINAQIKLMGDKQSALLFEGHTTCITDDEKEVPCSISVLAILDNDEINSFVAVLKDESLLP
jgi:PAS domain S-box-containing protein